MRQSSTSDPRLGTLRVSSIFQFLSLFLLSFCYSHSVYISAHSGIIHYSEALFSSFFFSFFFLFFRLYSLYQYIFKLTDFFLLRKSCSNPLLSLSSEFFILVSFLISKFSFGSFSCFLSLCWYFLCNGTWSSCLLLSFSVEL